MAMGTFILAWGNCVPGRMGMGVPLRRILAARTHAVRSIFRRSQIRTALNLSALKGEDSQARLRITTLTLAPEGSPRPHASGFETGTNPITAALYVLRLRVQLNHHFANLPGSCLAGSV